MTHNQTIKLLDGVFSAEDARSILLDLINSKINFLNRDAFSKHIRFSQDINHAEKRTSELREAINELLPFIAQAANEDFEVRLNGSIEIEIIKKTIQ